jgi:hypothetical protein
MPWKLSKALFTEEFSELLFTTTHVERGEEELTGEVTRMYEPVFASSSDYTNATDAFDLKIASMIGNFWMTDMVGIPKGLAVIANLLYKPRYVLFKPIN